MRFDPRRRLERPLPGARVTSDRTLRIHLSEDRPLPTCPVPARDERELLKIDTRPSRKRVEAGPNAPQLIRLVRYPFALATARPRRETLVEARAVAEARVPLGHPMREAVAERGEVRSTRAAFAEGLARPRAFAPRTSSLVVIPPLLADDS